MNKKFTIRMPEDEDVFYRSFRYPAGEVQTRLTPVGVARMKQAEETEIILHAVPDVMRLAQLHDAMIAVKRVFVRKLFLQYLPYGRADRRFMEGDSAGLEVFLKHLALMDFNSIWTFDAHNEDALQTIAVDNLISIANMKPTDHPVDQIEPCLVRMRKTGGIPYKEMALISPDEGASKRYDLSQYNMLTFVGGKKRDAATGKLNGFEMKLNSINETAAFASLKAALIVDDICDGGGTFIGLAEEIRKINPTIKLGLYTSHGIYSKGFAVLRQHFDWIFTSDYTFHKPGTNLEYWTQYKTGDESTPGVCIR